MGRSFFAALLLLPALTAAPGHRAVQPVFFSMLFPQLIPQCLLQEQNGQNEAAIAAGEAVFL